MIGKARVDMANFISRLAEAYSVRFHVVDRVLVKSGTALKLLDFGRSQERVRRLDGINRHKSEEAKDG